MIAECMSTWFWLDGQPIPSAARALHAAVQRRSELGPPTDWLVESEGLIPRAELPARGGAQIPSSSCCMGVMRASGLPPPEPCTLQCSAALNSDHRPTGW